MRRRSLLCVVQAACFQNMSGFQAPVRTRCRCGSQIHNRKILEDQRTDAASEQGSNLRPSYRKTHLCHGATIHALIKEGPPLSARQFCLDCEQFHAS
ncbi:hypothetical protein PoB_005994600 [Plakobranchus ocellatus]|uniref:Secreted protein n=1 Tax=Plakobranchus ocellatus TaxID=259542 RepID=A0AAV4CNK1_9GAST|nr:hypothetical protein PoB_005994600 [Plakobranchus ocellatus]